jgi:hypothetical protein
MIAVPFQVPVDPDAGPARQWIIAELSKPEYQAAQPTWFDRLSTAFTDWLDGLKLQTDGVTQTPVLLIVGAIVIAAVIAAYFVFGTPRLNRRSSSVGALFGDEDIRDAAAMRRAAQDAAQRADYAVAIQELFRAVARGLAERTIVTTDPGTTAVGFSVRAAATFPAFSDRLAAAAAGFDRVRYLGGDGTLGDYRALVELESGLRAARPDLIGAR